MAGNEVKITIIASGAEQAAAALLKVGESGARIGDIGKVVASGSHEAEGALGRLGETAKHVFEVFAGVSLANVFQEGIHAVKDFMVEASTLARVADVQTASFLAMAESVGVHGDALIEALKEASGQTVNTSDIMKSAFRGIQEGLDPRAMVELMEASRQLAKITGGEVVDAFNTMQTAIANTQVKQLKYQGVNIDVEQTVKEYAVRHGYLAQQIDATGRAHAIMEAVLLKVKPAVQALTGVNNEQGEALMRLKSNWNEYQENIGRIENAVLVGLLPAIVGLSGALAEATETGGAFSQAMTSTFASVGDLFTALGAQSVSWQYEWTSLWGTAKVLVAEFGYAVQYMTLLVTPAITFIGSVFSDLANKSMPDMTKATDAATAAYQKIEGQMSATAGEITKMKTELDDELRLLEDKGWQEFLATLEAIPTKLDLGTNKLGSMANQFRALTPEFDKLGEAMRSLEEKFEVAQLQGLDQDQAKLVQLTAGINKAIEATKGLTPAAVEAFQAWADSVARGIVAIERATEALKASYAIRATLVKATEAQMLADVEAAQRAATASLKDNLSARITNELDAAARMEQIEVNTANARIRAQTIALTAERNLLVEQLASGQKTWEEYDTAIVELDAKAAANRLALERSLQDAKRGALSAYVEFAAREGQQLLEQDRALAAEQLNQAKSFWAQSSQARLEANQEEIDQLIARLESELVAEEQIESVRTRIFQLESQNRIAQFQTETDKRTELALAEQSAYLKSLEDRGSAYQRWLVNTLAINQQLQASWGDVTGFFVTSFQLAIAKAGTFWDDLNAVAQSTYQQMRSGLSDFFDVMFQGLTGQIKTWNDFADALANIWKNMLNSMLKSVSDFLASEVMRQLFGTTAAAASGGGGSLLGSLIGSVGSSAAGSGGSGLLGLLTGSSSGGAGSIPAGAVATSSGGGFLDAAGNVLPTVASQAASSTGLLGWLAGQASSVIAPGALGPAATGIAGLDVTAAGGSTMSAIWASLQQVGDLIGGGISSLLGGGAAGAGAAIGATATSLGGLAAEIGGAAALGVTGGLVALPLLALAFAGLGPNSPWGFRPEGWSQHISEIRTQQQHISDVVDQALEDTALRIMSGADVASLAPTAIPLLQQLSNPDDPRNQAFFGIVDRDITDPLRAGWGPQVGAKALQELLVLYATFGPFLDVVDQASAVAMMNPRLGMLGMQTLPQPSLTQEQVDQLNWQYKLLYTGAHTPTGDIAPSASIIPATDALIAFANPAGGLWLNPDDVTSSGMVPRAQSGAWRTHEGLYYLHEDERVLNRLEAERSRAGVAGTGTTFHLTIAPGAIVINGVADPEKAAALAVKRIEESAQFGVIRAVIDERIRNS